MPSAYLIDGDKAAYGVPDATDPEIRKASVLIDAYLNRPEGVVFTPTAGGLPGYMSAKNPTNVFTAPGSIAPGQNVVVAITGAASMIDPGMPLVIDRAASNSVETSVVLAVNGSSITLDRVVFAHSAGVKLEAGMMITETRNLPQNRPLTLLAKTPIARILSSQGRYGFGRRGSHYNANINDFNLLATVSAFGGPPAWEPFTIGSSGIDAESGQIWVPSGVMMAYYTEVRVNYVAGWEYASLPDAIKLACAQLITALKSYSELQAGNVSMLSAGDHKVQRFAATFIDEDTKRALNSFVARLYV